MGFNIEIRDKNDLIVDWPRLDKEVCELWGVEVSDKEWASHPGKSVARNWHAFLGRAVMLQRAIKQTGTFVPTDLIQGVCLFGRLAYIMDRIDALKYEIQLLLYWTAKEYKIVVTNR